MELRYVVPPLLNLIFFLFSIPLEWNLLLSSFLVHQFSILELAFLIIAIMFLLLFLFASVKLELIGHPRTRQYDIRLRMSGGFSIAFTSSFLASLFFPPPLFLSVYLLIVSSSPWHGLFFEIFNHILGWFSGVLQSTPIYEITIITVNNEGPNRVPLREDEELGAMQQRNHQA
ncbi:hypothetical protein PTKIN_Ptkin17bG0152300 [Pterospermum kingtungense]